MSRVSSASPMGSATGCPSRERTRTARRSASDDGGCHRGRTVRGLSKLRVPQPIPPEILLPRGHSTQKRQFPTRSCLRFLATPQKKRKMSRPVPLHRKSRRHGGVRNGSPFRRGAAGCRWKCGFHTADTTPDQGSAEHLGLCRYRDSGLSTRVFHHTKPTFLMKLSPKYSDPCWVERYQ